MLLTFIGILSLDDTRQAVAANEVRQRMTPWQALPDAFQGNCNK